MIPSHHKGKKKDGGGGERQRERQIEKEKEAPPFQKESSKIIFFKPQCLDFKKLPEGLRK